MSGAPFDRDPERACSCHSRSGAAKNRATWVPWRDVNRKCAVRRAVAVEQNAATVLIATGFSVMTVSALLVWLRVS